MTGASALLHRRKPLHDLPGLRPLPLKPLASQGLGAETRGPDLLPISPQSTIFKATTIMFNLKKGCAMRSWGEAKPARARIEIIPMIDVMMFLLIFFVLISINVIPTLGVRTQLPKSSQVQELTPPARIIITIAKEGELLLDGRMVTLEEIPQRLREKQGENGKKPSVLVNGDESVRLQRLLDVLDVVKASGFDSLSIAARRK